MPNNTFEDYKKAMDLKANTSNNTVYADNQGNIAYWHGNFIPIRDKKLNWSKVIDGSISATQWKGLHNVNETVHLYNPTNEWLQNCNSTPYTVAGENSPKRENYLPYMAPDGENFRGVNAVRIFSKGSQYTLDKVIADGYDTKLSIFEILIPSLITVYEKNKTAYPELNEVISILKNWDYYAKENSVATTLAVEWAYKLDPIILKAYVDEGEPDQERADAQPEGDGPEGDGINHGGLLGRSGLRGHLSQRGRFAARARIPPALR